MYGSSAVVTVPLRYLRYMYGTSTVHVRYLRYMCGTSAVHVRYLRYMCGTCGTSAVHVLQQVKTAIICSVIRRKAVGY